MNRMTVCAALGAALLTLQACSTSSPVQDGALDCEGLTRVPASGLAGVCVQEGVSGNYHSALLDNMDYVIRPVGTSSSSVNVARPAGTRFQVGPQQKAELQAMMPEAFKETVAGLGLTPVNEPGAGVVKVRGQMLDVLFETPEDPESGAKYLFDRVARATLVVEFYDSVTDELILRAFDSRSSEPVNAEAEAGSEVEAIAGLWQAVLTEAAAYLPN